MSVTLEERPLDGSDISTLALDPVAGGRAFGDVDDGRQPIQTQQPGVRTRQSYLQLFQTAESQAVTFVDGAIRGQWVRSQKAFNNKHFDGSKYNSPQWKTRSRLFRPKTRIAVRKHCTNLAKAVFGPGDVVAITPQDETDKLQTASAAIKQELLNYRLSRTSRRNGLRWFQIVVGARQDSLVHGICVSKQTWRYVEEEDEDEPGGKPLVLEDRPDCYLYPPENVLFSPNADWTNPAQTSEVLILRHPMTISEVRVLVNSGNRGSVKFDKLDYDTLLASRSTTANAGSSDTQGVRSARHGGNDPMQKTDTIAPPIWLHEVFVKVDGRDMVFWVLGKDRVISEPVATRRAYPAFYGERPVVIGYGTIEAHRTHPMSPVESWQPIQAEINEQVNLRTDHMKQVVTPLAKVKRGRNIDMKAVQTRGGSNGVVLVQDKDDLDYVQIPDLPQSAYVENNYLNADFDDAAGTFNSGTVQTNRSLNETVGGMKLLAGDANSMGDYDVSIFVETWLEPVVWQLLKLEEYYETDAKILAIAGNKAKLIQKFGMDEITDELLQQETELTVKIGIGVTNIPQERLQKFAMASEIAGKVLEPFVAAGKAEMPSPKMAEIINSVFGDAGIPDAAERFFNNVSNDPPPPAPPGGNDPKAAEVQAKIGLMEKQAAIKQQEGQQKLQFERERHQQEMAQDRERMQHEGQMRQAEGAMKLQQTHQNMQVQQQMGMMRLQHGDMQAQQKLQHGAMQAEAQMAQQQMGQQMPGDGIAQLAQAMLAIAQGIQESNQNTQRLIAAITGPPAPEMGAPA